MNHAIIITFDFSIHELKNGKILPSSKKNGKCLGIMYGNSEQECMDKTEEIIKTYNLKKLEGK